MRTTTPIKPNRSSRAPAHIECAGGKSKRQKVWEAIRAAGDGWTTANIASAAGVDSRAVRTYLSALKAGGYITATYAAPHRAHRYALTNDIGIDAPRITLTGQVITMGLAQQHMWQTLRITGHALTPVELAGLSSTVGVPVSLTAARDYLGYLNRAGYLSSTGGRFRLIKNTGPKAPMVQRTKRVYDPNNDSVAMQEVDDGDI